MAAVARALGHAFRDPALLRDALTHRSFANERPDLAPCDNERLEFLGDAVLGLAVAAMLFATYPKAREGELTRRRADLICEGALCEVAQGIGLGAALRGLRRYDEARAEYERAIALDPARPEAYFNLGLLYQDYMQGQVAQLEKAKSYYGDFLERSKGDAALAQTREDLTRRCATAAADRRGKTSCRPGRLQVIDQTLAALREVQGTKP